MVAKEQSRASVVASTCGFLSAKARAKADTECSKVQSAKDVLVTRTTEEGRTTRAKEESETTRECRRLQRDEVIQTLHRSPWQNFTNTCTMLFGFTTLTNLVKNRVLIPSRALRFFVALLLFVLMSRSPAFRRMLTRFMFWRYPRFSRQSDGCSVSLDGRYLCFEKNSDVRILPPRRHATNTPLVLNFIGRHFQVGVTDGTLYWMVEAPANGKVRILTDDSESQTCFGVGEPRIWGVLIDLSQRTLYLTIEKNVERLCFAKDSITSTEIWPVVRGLAGEKIELVW